MQRFSSDVDENGDSVIEKHELQNFIENGIALEERDRNEYSERGGLHKTIVEFFINVESRLSLATSDKNDSEIRSSSSLQNSQSSIDTEIERLRSEFSFLQSSQKVISSPSTFQAKKAAKCQKPAVTLELLHPGPCGRSTKNDPQASVHLEMAGTSKSSVISPSSFSSPMSFHAAARLKRTARKAHHSASKSALGISALRPKLSASKSNKMQRRRNSGGNVKTLSGMKRTSVGSPQKAK